MPQKGSAVEVAKQARQHLDLGLQNPSQKQLKSANRNKLGRRIGPGIWEDADGNPHFSIPELLALVGLDDTPENRERVTAMIRKMVHEQNPEAPIVERKSWND